MSRQVQVQLSVMINARGVVTLPDEDEIEDGATPDVALVEQSINMYPVPTFIHTGTALTSVQAELAGQLTYHALTTHVAEQVGEATLRKLEAFGATSIPSSTQPKADA